MDPATLIGVVAALLVVIISNVMEGGNPLALIQVAPMLLVFGATLLISLAGGTMADAKGSMRGLRHAFTGTARSAGDLVPSIVHLAEKARREGLLALEDELKDIEDPFLVRAVTFAIDGTDPEELREILESEVDAKRAADKHCAKFFNDMGGYAPTIGIIGTVLGLVHVLENLSKPDQLGHLIAGAFVATLWGILSANVMWLPIASKLKRVSDVQCHQMELVVEGVLAIQSGTSPRVVQQKLQSFLPPQAAAQKEAA